MPTWLVFAGRLRISRRSRCEWHRDIARPRRRRFGPAVISIRGLDCVESPRQTESHRSAQRLGYSPWLLQSPVTNVSTPRFRYRISLSDRRWRQYRQPGPVSVSRPLGRLKCRGRWRYRSSHSPSLCRIPAASQSLSSHAPHVSLARGAYHPQRGAKLGGHTLRQVQRRYGQLALEQPVFSVALYLPPMSP